jgi:hypothetical protein
LIDTARRACHPATAHRPTLKTAAAIEFTTVIGQRWCLSHRRVASPSAPVRVSAARARTRRIARIERDGSLHRRHRVEAISEYAYSEAGSGMRSASKDRSDDLVVLPCRLGLSTILSRTTPSQLLTIPESDQDGVCSACASASQNDPCTSALLSQCRAGRNLIQGNSPTRASSSAVGSPASLAMSPGSPRPGEIRVGSRAWKRPRWRPQGPSATAGRCIRSAAQACRPDPRQASATQGRLDRTKKRRVRKSCAVRFAICWLPSWYACHA